MDTETKFHAIATKVKCFNRTKICFRVAQILGHETKFIKK